MKIIILAGGFGTRISEETGDKPKPMVLIDGKPMLWHIMSIYRKQGFNDFIIATVLNVPLLFARSISYCFIFVSLLIFQLRVTSLFLRSALKESNLTGSVEQPAALVET